jgi:hypothetical protein
VVQEERTFSLDLGIYVRALANCAHHHSQQPVRTAQSRIHQCSDTDKTTWDGELQLVLLGEEGHDLRAERSAGAVTGSGVSVDDSGPDLYLHSDLSSQLLRTRPWGLIS